MGFTVIQIGTGIVLDGWATQTWLTVCLVGPFDASHVHIQGGIRMTSHKSTQINQCDQLPCTTQQRLDGSRESMPTLWGTPRCHTRTAVCGPHLAESQRREQPRGGEWVSLQHHAARLKGEAHPWRRCFCFDGWVGLCLGWWMQKPIKEKAKCEPNFHAGSVEARMSNQNSVCS